ncbi:MAG: ABC transporter ATP-binding protein [Bacteroidetes bacterium]|nr:ABC transporter ATP-binding protein [Bacteroidota bacterium]
MIEVKDISFSYKKNEQIIKNVTFSVPKGAIYGFLGKNGSGKTTIIRLLLDLCKVDSGKIYIKGEGINRNTTYLYKNIGTLIESPSLYKNLSGKENLELFALYYGVQKERINDVLDIVGLQNSSTKKVRNYSLGMKQRLGIGLSILHDPELLILDEPLNGLDPQGIAEIRALLLKLNKEEGKTIFISSHLLGEIENTCSDVGIINNGGILFDGKISDLRKSLINKSEYFMYCDSPEKASTMINDELNICNRVENNRLIIEVTNKEEIPYIVNLLINNDIKLYEFSKQENSLETLFLKLTK